MRQGCTVSAKQWWAVLLFTVAKFQHVLRSLSGFLKYATWLTHNLVAQLKVRDEERAKDLGPSVLKQRLAGLSAG
jgi:hypothetical protein